MKRFVQRKRSVNYVNWKIIGIAVGWIVIPFSFALSFYNVQIKGEDNFLNSFILLCEFIYKVIHTMNYFCMHFEHSFEF